jgi:hypothetical protein
MVWNLAEGIGAYIWNTKIQYVNLYLANKLYTLIYLTNDQTNCCLYINIFYNYLTNYMLMVYNREASNHTILLSEIISSYTLFFFNFSSF